jgi:hypothetical protein
MEDSVIAGLMSNIAHWMLTMFLAGSTFTVMPIVLFLQHISSNVCLDTFAPRAVLLVLSAR